MRIVFMGTPDMAVFCLSKILDSGHDVVGVVTAPDQPAGRGRKIQQSAVKTFALSRGLRVLQPEKLKSVEFLEELRALKPELQVVVAFRMLPEVVWAMPPLGTINMHASYLPDYRGAAPINWVIINGEKETGVSTFFLDQAIDTGRIIFREKIPVMEGETAGSLHERIKPYAASITLKTIDAITSGNVDPIPQSVLMEPADGLKLAPRIFREDCRIDWSKSNHEIINLIRGLNPQPGAFFEMEQEPHPTILIKIFEAEPVEKDHSYNAGMFFSDNKQYIMISTVNGFINVKQLQLPGKRPMSAAELLRGYNFRNSRNL